MIYWQSDYGPMAVPPGDWDDAALSKLARDRYLRGEDLSTLSKRVLSRKERIGETARDKR